jgi:hypothetical protein
MRATICTSMALNVVYRTGGLEEDLHSLRTLFADTSLKDKNRLMRNQKSEARVVHVGEGIVEPRRAHAMEIMLSRFRVQGSGFRVQGRVYAMEIMLSRFAHKVVYLSVVISCEHKPSRPERQCFIPKY